MPIDVLDEPTQSVADTVCEKIAALDWPTGLLLKFRVVTVPELDQEELGKETHVLFGAEDVESERTARGSTADLVSVSYAVRAKCGAANLERFRWLSGIAYTIGRHILTFTRNDCGATPRRVVTRMLRDNDRLRGGEFITIRTAEFFERREI